MRFVNRLAGGCVLLIALAPVGADQRTVAQTATPVGQLPPVLETYLGKDVHLSAADRKALVSGSPVTKILDSDASKEVAVFGAVWINASPAAYVARVNDIENFEKGGAFRITKRISDPPKPDDFAQMDLPARDVADLRDCRIGDCGLKLGAHTLQKLRREVHWSTPDATAQAEGIVRRAAFDYVTGYRAGGNARLAVYRDSDDPVFVGQEFRSMIERLPALAPMPDMQRYLLDYPSATLSGGTDFLYWQEAQFGLKPTIRINHLIIQERPDVTIVASKMLYATHYFWTALELRVLTPDPSRGGFWFVTMSRSRSDGLSGFIGRFVRGRVRKEALRGTLTALSATKARLETGR